MVFVIAPKQWRMEQYGILSVLYGVQAVNLLSDVRHTGNFSYTSRQPGSTSGLQLALHVDRDNYMYASSPSTGFRVS